MSKRDINEVMGIGAPAEDKNQEQSGCGDFAKWILITLCVVAGPTSDCAPFAALVLFVGILLTFTGEAASGGNDSRENRKQK